MKPDVKELRGFVQPRERGAGFVTPVFADRERRYCQMIGKGAIIDDFIPIEDVDETAPFIGAEPGISAARGSNALYAFAFGPNDVLHGSRRELADALKPRLDDEPLDSKPFLRLNVAAFVRDAEALNESIARAAHELSTLNRKVAFDWRTSVDAAFDPLRPHTYNHEKLWDKLSLFSLALMRLYRSYRRFLHATSGRNRATQLLEYRAAVSDVLQYYLDADLYYLIRRAFRDIPSDDTSQKAVVDEYDANRARYFAQLGASSKQLDRVLKRLRKGKRFGEALASQDSILSEPLLALISFDQEIFDETILHDRLAAAEKKVRKRELRDGVLALSYGLVLLLRSQERQLVGNHVESRTCRALAIESLGAALMNIAPPKDVRNESLGFVGADF